MNLSEKVGQLLIFGIPDFQLTPDVISNLNKWHVGGIILFSRNLQNRTQAKKLISDLNELLSSSEYPLWLCVDQEGGVVVRMTQGVSVFPGNMALGAAYDPRLAYEMGRLTAQEWGALGVNVNLAPVLDLCDPKNPGIGVRSLGEEKNLVAEMGAELIRGMQEHGLCATAKHFPGKGRARKDSHLDLPVIAISKKELLEVELHPFKKAIEVGVDFMMSSHSVYSAIDSNPATLSKPILTDLLKKELGFKGLVISDDLEMGAVVKSLPVEEAALKFLQAGGDQVLVCHTPVVQEKVFQRLLEAVKNKELSEKFLDEKLKRIQLIKQKWQKGKINRERQATSDELLPLEIAHRSITIARNKQNEIPLKVGAQEQVLAVCVDYSPLTLVEESTSNGMGLKQLLAPHCPKLDFVKVPLQPKEEEISPLLAKANKADLLLIFTYNAHMYPEQARFVRALLKKGKKQVVCPLRNPYDLPLFPEVKNCVLSYGFREVSLKALVDVLFGVIPAKGKCPVSL